MGSYPAPLHSLAYIHSLVFNIRTLGPRLLAAIAATPNAESHLHTKNIYCGDLSGVTITARMCARSVNFREIARRHPITEGKLGILGRRSQCDWKHQFENSYRVNLLVN
jgi:hypothetical protein